MLYVYSTPDGAGRAMTREEYADPWPMLCVAVFDDDHEEEAADLLHWLAPIGSGRQGEGPARAGAGPAKEVL